LRVYKEVALHAFDFLARVEAARIDARPPFLLTLPFGSALLTLWPSIIAAVGLASRSVYSRHFT
jgi:hypothetical protein